MNTVSINCKDISKRYGSSFLRRRSKNVLKDVSFKVEHGERVGVIGENGAGKSTLLKIIAGTAPPSSGTLKVNGNVHAVLTLSLGLREELTGLENLYLEAEIHGKSRDEIAPYIEQMINFADLGAFIHKPVRTYSSGMKSRLTFTSLVFIEPEILLLDETLSTGDQWFQQKAVIQMRELCDRGKIVLLVSHSMQSIVSMCNRCIWIKDGKIWADGSPEEVTSAYQEYQQSRIDDEMETSIPGGESYWSETSDVEISAIQLISQGRGGGKLWVTGCLSCVEVDLNINRKLTRPSLACFIERVDGLGILDTRMPDELGSQLERGRKKVSLDFGELMVGPGLFRAHITLLEDGQLIAERKTTFKIVLDTPLLGGRPILHYPISLSCSPSDN